MPLVVDAGVVPDVDDAHFCWCDVLKNPHNNRLVFEIPFYVIYIHIKKKRRKKKMERIYCPKKSKHKFVKKKKKNVHPPFPSFFDLLTRSGRTTIRSIFASSSTIFSFFFFSFNSAKDTYFTTNRSQKINISFIRN